MPKTNKLVNKLVKELSEFQLSVLFSSRTELTVIFNSVSLITAQTAARKDPHSKAIKCEKEADDYRKDSKLGHKPSWKVSPLYADRNDSLLH